MNPSGAPLTLPRRLAIALLPTLILLFVGESGARAYYFFRHGQDLHYLITPLWKSRQAIRSRAVYPYEPRETYSQLDPCSNRRITFTVNRQGGRGPEWEITRPPDGLRIAAVGGSSTFGVNNPDQATWPFYLEQVARSLTGKPVEVLNAGQPGYSLKDFTRFYLERLAAYRPDWVIYYEGWNDTDLPLNSQVHHNVRRFHEHTWAGRISDWLYCRSMLYTYLLEKIQFTLVSRKAGVLPDSDRFQKALQEFIRSARGQGSTPVLVLQMVKPQREKGVQEFQQALRDLDLEDRSALDRLIREAIRRGEPTSYDPLTRLRVYQAEILKEVIRRSGSSLGVQVIDPTPAFLRYPGLEPIFCDVVHLTDRGNLLLAQVISEHLAIPAKGE